MTKTTLEKNLVPTTPSTASALSKAATPVTASGKSSSGATSGATSNLVAEHDVRGFQLTPPMLDLRGWDVRLANGVQAWDRRSHHA